jgi:hypothetical protein
MCDSHVAVALQTTDTGGVGATAEVTDSPGGTQATERTSAGKQSQW